MDERLKREEPVAGQRARARDIAAALRAAFPYTVPILAGFSFLGFSYGVYMHALGFSFVYPLVMAWAIFGGSLEFVTAGMLVSPFAPLTVLAVSLAVQARHIFYGITMLDKYRDTGWMRPYLIFAMCDETFSILCSTDPPAGVDRRWFMFWVTFLNRFYWIASATLGGLLGNALTFSIKGIDFVMTALFVVILLDRILKEHNHIPTLVGAIVSIAALTITGPDNFMLVALAVIVLVLLGLRNHPSMRAASPSAPTELAKKDAS
ncbi:MAG: AzlC family ABC transporter permease [Atopobiaceae bacterium]|jgi:4-azaleucine resistance transporter AzlC